MAAPARSGLVFAVGPDTYAVPAPVASEIVTFAELTKLPNAPAHVTGLLPHRGEIIPVVDLSVLRGRSPLESRRAVLVRVQGGVFAATVSRVSGVADLQGAGKPLGEGDVERCFSGPFKARVDNVWLIDPDALFALLRQSGSSAT